jgi:hypothetical protein
MMKTPRPMPLVVFRQLSLTLDAAKLRGLSPTERGRALALLARLLLEAAGAMAQEHDDERA